MSQLIQVAGSLLILAAYAAGQRGVLNQRSLTYLVMNLVGSAVLAVEAGLHEQWGFLLLEGVWAIVSAAGLYRALRAPSGVRPVGAGQPRHTIVGLDRPRPM